MKINVLHHFGPWKKPCEFHGILTILRWFLKQSHSAVAVPHHCRPLYMTIHLTELDIFCVSGLIKKKCYSNGVQAVISNIKTCYKSKRQSQKQIKFVSECAGTAIINSETVQD